MEQERRQSRRYIGFLILSLLLHLLLLVLIPLARLHTPEPPEETALDVDLIKQPTRIADILKPEQEEKADKPDFLGMYDTKTDQPQVAVSQQKPGVPTPAKPSPAERPKPQAKPKDLASLYAMRREQSRPQQNQSEQAPAQQRGLIPEDFYPDYKVGPHTYLNVLRYPEVQYFVRMKRIFKMTFNPGPALRSHFFANQISRGQVEVVLGVAVDPTGKLAQLFVINSSGLKGYDDEALRTVRDSAPFAHPPKELLGPDGKLRMSWTFTVYL